MMLGFRTLRGKLAGRNKEPLDSPAGRLKTEAQYHKTQKNAFGFQSYSPRICLINTSDLADLTLGGDCEPQQAEDECVFILNSS